MQPDADTLRNGHALIKLSDGPCASSCLIKPRTEAMEGWLCCWGVLKSWGSATGASNSPASTSSPNAFQMSPDSPSGNVAEQITSLMHYDSVMPNEEDSFDGGPLEQHMRKSSELPRTRPQSSPAGVAPTKPHAQTAVKPKTQSQASPQMLGPSAAAAQTASKSAGSTRSGQQASTPSAGDVVHHVQKSPTRAEQSASSSLHGDARDQGHFATSSPRSGQPGLPQTSPRKQSSSVLNLPAANGASSAPAAPLSNTGRVAGAPPMAAADRAEGAGSQISSAAAPRADLPLLMDFEESATPDKTQSGASSRAGNHAPLPSARPSGKPAASLLDADFEVSLEKDGCNR